MWPKILLIFIVGLFLILPTGDSRILLAKNDTIDRSESNHDFLAGSSSSNNLLLVYSEALFNKPAHRGFSRRIDDGSDLQNVQQKFEKVGAVMRTNSKWMVLVKKPKQYRSSIQAGFQNKVLETSESEDNVLIVKPENTNNTSSAIENSNSSAKGEKRKSKLQMRLDFKSSLTKSKDMKKSTLDQKINNETLTTAPAIKTDHVTETSDLDSNIELNPAISDNDIDKEGDLEKRDKLRESSPIVSLEYWIPADPTLEIKGSKKVIPLTDLNNAVKPILTLTSPTKTTTSTISTTLSPTSPNPTTTPVTPILDLDHAAGPELSFGYESTDIFQERQDNNDCYVQTCDQTITGRQLAYNRALDIVQNEEYLEVADTDIIRRQFTVKERAGFESEILRRFRRQIAGPGVVSQGLLDLFNDITLSRTDWCAMVTTATADNTLTTKIQDNCGALLDGGCEFYSGTNNELFCVATNVQTAQEVQFSVGVFGSNFQGASAACESYSTEQTVSLCTTSTTTVTTTTTATTTTTEPTLLEQFIEGVAEAAPPAAAGAGAGAAAGLATFPEFPLVTNVATPPGSPAPGAPGGIGGGTPSQATPAQLNLVPQGLTPVATFPPYATPRTFPADSVIFLENPNVDLLVPRSSRLLRRFKRSLLGHIGKLLLGHNQQSIARRRNYEHNKRRSLWDEIKSGASKIVDKVGKEIRKAKRAMRLLNKNMMCLRTRLMALNNQDRMKMLIMTSQYEQYLLRKKKRRRQDSKSFQLVGDIKDFKLEFKGKLKDFATYIKDDSNDEDDLTINSLDDCIDGIEEPLYGFRTNVTLIDNEPCILGETCRATLDGEQIDPLGGINNSDGNETETAEERQSGEEFTSDAPAECRVRFDAAASGCSRRRRRRLFYSLFTK